MLAVLLGQLSLSAEQGLKRKLRGIVLLTNGEDGGRFRPPAFKCGRRSPETRTLRPKTGLGSTKQASGADFHS